VRRRGEQQDESSLIFPENREDTETPIFKEKQRKASCIIDDLEDFVKKREKS